MKELIGLPFKRNVYGPSIWTDIVKDVKIHWKIQGSLLEFNGTKIPVIMIEGSNHWFPLSELIFIKDLDVYDKWMLRTEQLRIKRQKEWLNKQ
jgi:hypothetical protein